MKILSFGDTHVNQTHQFSKTTETGYSVRLHEHLNTFKEIAKKIEELKPDVVNFGGDLFHTQSKIDVQVLDIATDCMELISNACVKLGIPFHIIVGNHDFFSDNNDVANSLRPFKFLPNGILHEKMEESDNMVFIPYVQESWRINQFLETIKDKQNKVALVHLDFIGARFHESLFDNTGLDINLFKEFKKVIGHHYHLPQDLGNISFPGSPQRWSFREPDNEMTRGLILYDTESNKMERIKLDSVPLWLTFDDSNLNELKDIDDNCYVRLLLSSDYMLECNGISKVSLERFKGLEIQYDVERINPVNISRSEEEIKVVSEDVILKEFIEHQEYDDKFKEKLIETGMDLLNKVRQ